MVLRSVGLANVKEISVCGDTNIAVTNTGEAYIWPIICEDSECVGTPIRIPLTENIQVESVSCGDNFAILLSNQGLVFSFGQATAQGQLGHGDYNPKPFPELIVALKNVRVQSIVCGYKHTIAKTTLGKVYTWGWGEHGQLGHNQYVNELIPRALEIVDVKRVVQIAAGYSHSVILAGKHLYWFGTCEGIKEQAVPIKVPLDKLFPELFSNRNIVEPVNTSTGTVLANTMSFFTPIRISVNWSYTAVVTSIIVLDMRGLANEGLSVVTLNSQLHTLSSKWNPKETYPPFIEVIAGYFSSGLMKKFKTISKKKNKGKNNVKKKIRNTLNVKNLTYDSQDKALIAKSKEVEETLRNALNKEEQTDKEKALISYILTNLP